MAITKESLSSAVINSSIALNNLADLLKSVVFPEPVELTFETAKLNDKYISDILKDVPSGYAKEYKETDFIYVFEIQNSSKDIKERIYNGLCSSREVQSAEDFEGKKDICRPIHQNSDYLYVGRSQKLRSRLKQHLDAGSDGIYAMHMLRWSSGIDSTIKVYCYQFDKYTNLTVQALEDGLWDTFKPMFGRKGEK